MKKFEFNNRAILSIALAAGAHSSFVAAYQIDVACGAGMAPETVSTVTAPMGQCSAGSEDPNGQGYAAARVDIASGMLQTIAVGSSNAPPQYGSAASASVTDTFTLHGSSPAALVDMFLLVQGAFWKAQDALTQLANGTISFSVDSGPGLHKAVSYEYAIDGGNSFTSSISEQQGVSVITMSADPSYIDLIFYLHDMLPTNTPLSLRIGVSTTARAANGYVPQESMTADLYTWPTRFFIELPSGVSISDESGVLRASTTVPLPGAMWLLCGGLLIGAPTVRRTRVEPAS